MYGIIIANLHVKMNTLSFSQVLWLIQVHNFPKWQKKGKKDRDLFLPTNPVNDGSHPT